ncbi:substrate-binding domain-containing protein [Pseudonocardia benzenivorans]
MRGQGGSSNGSSAAADPAAVQKATDATTALSAPPTFGLTDADKVDPAGAAGKKLWIIDISSSIPLVQVSDAATTQALGLVGATVKTYDGKGSVTEYTRGIQAAIADKADVIALYAIDPNLVAGPIQAAADAGIKVVVVQYGDPGAQLPKNVAAQVTYPYTDAGAAMANFIVSDAKGAAVGVEFISASDVSNSKAIVGGFQDTLKAACPNCSLTVDDVPVADWQTKITTQVNSTLGSHPDIKYVVPVYDGMATFAVPAIKTSGKKDVKLVSFNATKSIMQNLKDGDTVAADVGSPQAWRAGRSPTSSSASSAATRRSRTRRSGCACSRPRTSAGSTSPRPSRPGTASTTRADTRSCGVSASSTPTRTGTRMSDPGPFSQVKPVRAYEAIVAQFDEAIRSGAIRPGDRLPSERELMRQFGVGRSTVREALRVLQSNGMVRSRPGDRRGPEVVAFSTELLHRPMEALLNVGQVTLYELIFFRMVTEGSLAGLAATRSGVDPDGVAQLWSLVQDLKDGAARGMQHFLKADTAFHEGCRGWRAATSWPCRTTSCATPRATTSRPTWTRRCGGRTT